MRSGTKADLLVALEGLSIASGNTPQVDAAVLDGAVIVQMLSPGQSKTVQDYIDSKFVPYIMRQLQSVNRLDIVWEVYRPDSLKKATREQRGTGIRRRVAASSHVPGNWQSFLRVVPPY